MQIFNGMYRTIMTVLFFGAAGHPGFSQSTLTLESFDLDDFESVPLHSAVDCLIEEGQCDSSFVSERTFSLDDLVALGVVDRRTLAVPPGANAEEVARSAAAPLPSIDIEVRFEFASDRLSDDQVGPLYVLARDLQRMDLGERQLVLFGHTDSVGSAEFNRALSMRRAETVAHFLSQHGAIPRHRIITHGMGFDALRYPHDPRHAANRRVQIMLAPI